MIKVVTTLLVALVVFQPAYATTGTEQVRKYFKIEKTVRVDENVVRDAILKIVPVDTKLKEAIKRLERHGIQYNQTCSPGDRSPIWCYFASPKNQVSEANYTVEFFFDNQNKFKNVEVVRSYRSKAKRFTSYPTRPANNLILKNNLTVGSQVKTFDATYGMGQLNTSTDFANDWPVTLEYFDKQNKNYFYVGVEIGEISPKEMRAVEQDRSKLGEMKAGIIFTEWPDPLLNK